MHDSQLIESGDRENDTWIDLKYINLIIKTRLGACLFICVDSPGQNIQDQDLKIH